MTSEQIVSLIIGFMTLLGVIVTGLLAYCGAKNAQGANNAVNNKPDGSKKLYDIALRTDERVDLLMHWYDIEKDFNGTTAKEKIARLEVEVNTLYKQVSDIDNRTKEMNQKLDKIISKQD